MKRKFFALVLLTCLFTVESFAIEITVFGRGGIRGKRVCPKSSVLACAVIKSYTEDINPGDNVDVDMYSINGSMYWTGNGIFLGYAPQGVDVDFGGDIYIDDPNDPNP